jgi:hypothetical protein
MTWVTFKNELTIGFFLSAVGIGLAIALFILYTPYFMFHDIPKFMSCAMSWIVRGRFE